MPERLVLASRRLNIPTSSVSRKLPALTLVLAALACSTLASIPGCQQGPATVQAQLGEARRLSADLRVQFSRAADASNRAVMADTDQASLAFAHEAEDTLKLVEQDVTALNTLTHSLGVADEVQILERFQKQFADYRVVDNNVLALAVENTNLKAQQLSFGPAREAADRFKAALAQLPPSLAAKDRCRAEELVASAVLNVRELQTLQGPHIASSDDAAMTAMEQQLAALESKTAAALSALANLADASSLGAAQTAFEQFKTIGQQIVTLSRRNSNVRSLDLSLRVKPPLANACEESARALQNALANEGSKATR
ncbi:MAG: MCP four helix bundle domain-containing protein [Pseudomonadota bacterium]